MIYFVYSVSERDVPRRNVKWSAHLHSKCHMFRDQASILGNLNRPNVSELHFRVDVSHPDVFAVPHLLSTKYYISSRIKRVYLKLSQRNLKKRTLVKYGIGMMVKI